MNTTCNICKKDENFMAYSTCDSCVEQLRTRISELTKERDELRNKIKLFSTERHPMLNSNMVECPYCSGDGYEGFDRCCPPGKIICGLCEGSKEILKSEAEVFKIISDVFYPASGILYADPLTVMIHLEIYIKYKEVSDAE